MFKEQKLKLPMGGYVNSDSRASNYKIIVFLKTFPMIDHKSI